jgi:peptide/nickel transport system substrate-binding protein
MSPFAFTQEPRWRRRAERPARTTWLHRPVWMSFVAALLVLAACDGADTAENEDGDGAPTEIVVSMLEDADTLDPTFGQTFGGRYVFANMCEKLYDINANLEIVPQLAEDLLELSDDGLTATISLRQDAVFNDGEPFNAEAVATSLDRHREADESARAGELAPVTEVKVVDEYTVELSLSEPYAPLDAILADRSGMIMSPAALEELGEDFTQDPVCVGPYTVVDRVVGDRIVLEKSDDYYDADQVHIDRVVMRPIPDATVRIANLRSGELDIVDRVPTTEFESLENESGIVLDSVPSLAHDSIILNLQSGPFQDEQVREAFELALDPEQINASVFNGLHTATCQPFPETTPYFMDDLTCPERDVSAAAELLEQAGVDTPVSIDLLMLNDTLGVRRGELIQAQAEEAGFEVNVRPAEVGTLIDDATKGNFDAVILTWSGRVDPDGNLAVFQHSEGSQNFGGASDPEIDAAIEGARAVPETEERAERYSEAWQLCMERHSQVMLMSPNILVGWREGVEEFEMLPDGLLRLKGVSLTS